MKYRFVTLLLVLISLGTQPLLAQFMWARYVDNPVFTPGDPPEWDGGNIRGMSVIRVNDSLKMWYGGDNQLGGDIGYAWSTDGGITWEEYVDNPVLAADQVIWQNLWLEEPTVIYDGTTYLMWFLGEKSNNVSLTGFATSANGIDWTVHPDPVLESGPDGAWDQADAVCGGVVLSDTLQTMLYNGSPYAGSGWQIGRATSTDTLNWVKDTLNNPVIPSTLSWSSSFWLADEQYECLYVGPGFDYYFASSDNSIDWDLHGSVFTRGANDEWDGGGLHYSTVLYVAEDPLYHMWYQANAHAAGEHFNLGYATSLKGLTGFTSELHGYYSPGGEVLISLNYNGPVSEIVLLAQLMDYEESVLDSIQLFDDGNHADGEAGDDIYANTLSLPDEETFYKVGLSADYAGEEIINYSDLGDLTSTGPLQVFGHEQLFPDAGEISPGGNIYFDLFIENLGLTATVTDIDVQIFPGDTMSMDNGYSYLGFPDVEPGESIGDENPNAYFGFRVNENATVGTPIPLTVRFSTNGIVAFEDSFNYGTVGMKRAPGIPSGFEFDQNFPNPFNPITQISYSIPSADHVSVLVYDVRGTLVRTLADRYHQAGEYSLTWDGVNDLGFGVTTGIYFARLEAGRFSDMIKMIYLK